MKPLHSMRISPSKRRTALFLASETVRSESSVLQVRSVWESTSLISRE